MLPKSTSHALIGFVHQAHGLHEETCGGESNGLAFWRCSEFNLKIAVEPTNDLISDGVALHFAEMSVFALARIEVKQFRAIRRLATQP